MEKFAINLDNLKLHVLFECILQHSAVAQVYDYEEFYTNAQKEPENWHEEFYEDIHSAVHHVYNSKNFYICHTNMSDDNCIFDEDTICYVFFGNKIYSFDRYYTDCPIFQKILKQ